MSLQSQRQSNLFVALSLGVAALILYVLTLSRGAFPGDSALYVSRASGLFPLLSPEQPLWRALVAVLERLPLGTLVFRLNLLSAVCAAAVVGLLYRVVTDAVWLCLDMRTARQSAGWRAAQAAGLGAALFLAVATPFWVVANRAHPGAFDILLLLAVVWVLMGYGREGGAWRLTVLALLYGVGVAEYATFILFFPLVAPLTLYCMWKREQLTLGRVTLALLAGLLGLCVYLLAAWAFLDSPGYHLRGYTGFWNVIFHTLRGQYLLLVRSLPVTGWLLILLLTAVPWLAAVGMARRSLNGERDWAYYFLHFVMTLLVIGTLFNVRFAPWPMLGMQRLLVMPYVLSAVSFGYLVAYWYLLLATAREGEEEAVGVTWRKGLAVLTLVLGGVGVVVAAVLNFPRADARGAAAVNRYAEAVVEHLGGRTWLVTDGVLDFNIQLAAQARGVPLKVISLGWAQSLVLMDHAAAQLGETRYRNVAKLGMQPLLKEWLASGPDVTDQVALLTAPDLWLQVGLQAVPRGLLFVGRPVVAPAEVPELVAYHEQVWQGLAWLTAVPRGGGSVAAYLPGMRRQVSMVANNLGVLLEDLGAAREAAAAYRRALVFVEDNISALLNLHVLVAGGVAEDPDGAVKARLDALAGEGELEQRKQRIWELARVYGFVRLPQAFAELGWYWAATGQAGMAASGLQKAMTLLPEERQGGVKEALAGVYLMQERPKESEALYYELLVENPQNQKALLGMARIAMLRGQHADAKTYLEKAEGAGVPAPLMELEWAAFDLQSGRTAEARAKVERLIVERPELTRAWAMYVAMLLEQNDAEELARCIRRMEANSGSRGFLLSVARGHLAIMRNDADGARYAFEEARRLDPANVMPLEVLLRLDLVQGLRAEAERHAVDLLKRDAGHALGNYIMATLHLHAGKPDLAKDSLRRSLARQLTPNALNDLAFLLAESGLYAEAELHARKVLTMRPDHPQALDTLGFILMRTGRLAEAQACFEKTLAAKPGHVEAGLHLIEAHLRQGARAAADGLIRELEGRREELPEEQVDRLTALKAGVLPVGGAGL